MLRDFPILLYLFLAISAAHLWALIEEMPSLAFWTKPLLLLVLSLYFFLRTRSFPVRFRNLLLAGMIFSIAGDTFLMFEGPSFFLLGLGSFLITQVCYASAFLSHTSLRWGILIRRPWVGLPLFIYLGWIATFLWPDLAPSFRWPVLLYSVVITSMALSCLNLYGTVPTRFFIRLFAGVLFFLLSDSLIALTRFKAIGLAQADVWIMMTYLIAQYLIATAGIRILARPAAPAE